MTDLHLAIEAARLLGRWTLIAEKHANGCSCCPGLGDVTMEQVEGSVAAWLRERHALLQDGRNVTSLLKDCISRRFAANGEVLQPLFKDIGEAFDHLERVQRGF
jgi:hypothetical protein